MAEEKQQKKNYTLPMAIVIAGLLISVAYIYVNEKKSNSGSNESFEKMLEERDKQIEEIANQKLEEMLNEEFKTVKASVDDDPSKGNKDSKVVIIEFSDYECPYCKKYYTDTYGSLMTQYVDTGQVQYVFRDYPLSFHDPVATEEAVVANCAKELAGDEAYFKMHDLLFQRTGTNGKGVADSPEARKLIYSEMATGIGLNVNAFNECNTKADTTEIKKDIADAGTYGVASTPSFLIGVRNDNGEIETVNLPGAQPLANFQMLIDKALSGGDFGQYIEQQKAQAREQYKSNKSAWAELKSMAEEELKNKQKE